MRSSESVTEKMSGGADRNVLKLFRYAEIKRAQLLTKRVHISDVETLLDIKYRSKSVKGKASETERCKAEMHG